jgi:hypothetical protein
VQEKIGHLSKGIDAPLRRAALNGVFEFRDDGMIELLQDAPHVWFSTQPSVRNPVPDIREGVGNSNGTMGVAALRSR